MNSISYPFLLSLAVILLGYISKVCGILNEEHGKSLSKVIINITLPALILTTLSTIELDFSLFLLPVFCLAFSFLTARIARAVLRRQGQQEKGVGMLTAVGFNAGLFAYPLIEGIFGYRGLKLIAMFDFGNAFIVFGLSYLLGYHFSAKHTENKLSIKNTVLLFLKSVPFMSYLLAIAINISGLKLPTPVSDVLGICGKANMAMALLVLGLTLNFRFDKKHWKLILQVLGVRYGSGLLCGTLLFICLPFPPVYRTILLFGLNLPVGLASIPFAVEFGYDPRIAGTIGNFTIIISFLFMWGFLLIHGLPA